jgi:hypothetical protein
MNLKHIINEIEQADPKAFEQSGSRRSVIKNIGSKLALAAVPFAASSLFNKAAAKTTANAVVDALNVILEQKYLEYAFFRHGNNTGALIPSSDLPGFQAIEAHDKAQINFLNVAITNLGGTPFKPNHFTDPTTVAPYVPAAYDFTAGGTYSTVFSNYSQFLIIAQIIKDTGIHAINGQIQYLLADQSVCAQIFGLQGTEGRHAAYIRLVRRLSPTISPEYPAPWITNNIPPTIPLQPYYITEENALQKGVIITSLPDTYVTGGTVPMISATAAFDEGYDAATVKNLMAGFKVA